jgi:WD40-like Beta Propeller Repeat
MGIRRTTPSHSALAVVLIAIVAAASLLALCGGTSASSATAPGSGSTAASPTAVEVAYTQAPGKIAFIRGMELCTIRPDGSELKRIARHALGAAWSPDGTQLAYGGMNGVYVVKADGSGPHQVASTHGGVEGIAWTPDGGQIVFSTWKTS